MADDRVHGGFVEDDEVGNDVAQPIGHDGSIIGETFRRVARTPAALVLQRLRQVPVEQGRIGRDVPFVQRLAKAFVIVDARLVHGAGAIRHDAGPGDREAIGAEMGAGDQRDVVPVAAIAVAGDGRVGVIDDRLGLAREHVPDAVLAAIRIGRAFDLRRRGGDAPFEVFRKLTRLRRKRNVRAAGGGGDDGRAGGERRERAARDFGPGHVSPRFCRTIPCRGGFVMRRWPGRGRPVLRNSDTDCICCTAGATARKCPPQGSRPS